MRVCLIIFFICVELNNALGDDIKAQKRGDKITAVAPENDDRLLLFATLDGSFVNVDRFTGDIKWNVKDRPTFEVPLNVEDATEPIFLPDPRDGSLYLLDNSREPIRKLPFTIPQLVASSPCRSSDGILYTGKKKDAWFKLDPSTGMRQQIIGWDTSSPTCPVETSLFVYIGRTKYTIAMIDSNKPEKKWNVTFFDYTSKPVGVDDMANFDLVLFASSSTGKIIALNRRSGHFLWELDLESPVVGIYLLDSEGLLTVPYTMLANHTITYLSSELSTSDQTYDQKGSMKLYPTLYIGHHKSGLYAIPSLVDQNVVTITSSDAGKLLLSGPNSPEEPQPYPEIPIPGQNYHLPPEMYDRNSFTFQSIPSLSNHISIYIGHYNVPKFSNLRFMLPEKIEPLKLISDGTVVTPKKKEWDDNRFMYIENEPDNVDMEEEEYCNVSSTAQKHWAIIKYINNYAAVYQDLGDLQRYFVAVAGMILMLVIYTVVLMQFRLRPNLSRSVSKANDDILQIGKITVNLDKYLGSGCKGTVVFRGTFEGRPIAVKRFMTQGPKQLELIEREVALLKESDDHKNVIRYFCTEEDTTFRYIALELCQATVFEYIEEPSNLPITPLEIIRQTTEGLAHLHSLGIVHRDLKPHNVLISMNDSAGNVKALISDFGFCKKLQMGKYSCSGTGIEGSEGWTAPETLTKEPRRMTSSVDIFSLGCLFYYVLSGGDHPFGDIFFRKANIASCAEADLKSLKGKDWEVNTRLSLIKAMISINPEERPICTSILSHPIFWDATRILNFFQDVSDRVEILKGEDEVLKNLELGGDYIAFQDWGKYIHEDLIADLRKFRTYFGRSVRDLLRALRNKKNHYRELTEEAQNVLGDFPTGYCHYWVERFPLLLIHTYLSMQCVASEGIFLDYYKGGHKYSVEDLRKQAEEYCESHDIFIDVNIPAMDLSPHRDPRKQKSQNLSSSREGGATKSYRNKGPLKSKPKKSAHKRDEPLVWVMNSSTNFDVGNIDQKKPDDEEVSFEEKLDDD